MAEYVYVILDPLQFAVKIGYSYDPVKRLGALQTAHSRSELKLLSIFEGGKKEESLIHEALYKYKLQGEWFEFTDQVKNYLLDLQKSVYDNLKITPFSKDHNKLEEYCEQYLQNSITKKRTRVPMKYLKTCFTDLKLAEIKYLIISLGYTEWKDKAGNLHYYK